VLGRGAKFRTTDKREINIAICILVLTCKNRRENYYFHAAKHKNSFFYIYSINTLSFFYIKFYF